MLKRVELYTTKLETSVEYEGAKIGITVSATKGSVEAVNAAMQRAVDALRAAFPETSAVGEEKKPQSGGSR